MAERYVIELTDGKHRKFFEELLAQLAFVKVEGPSTRNALKLTKKEKEFMDGLREAVQEMKDDLSGKKKLPSLKEALDELRR